MLELQLGSYGLHIERESLIEDVVGLGPYIHHYINTLLNPQLVY